MTFHQRKTQRDYRERTRDWRLKRWHVVIAALLIIIATVVASAHFSPWGTHHGSTVLREVR